MIRTANIVIVGGDDAAIAAASDAARRGLRVVIVLESSAAKPAQRLRQRFRRLELPRRGLVVVLSGAEVACVGGVHAIEAVVVRYVRSGRLIGFNTNVLLSFGVARVDATIVQ